MKQISQGKVRDIYEIDADRLVIVASDRISAFDVVLDQPIPDKGRVLTGLSAFWFARTVHICPNHMISCDPKDLATDAPPGAAMLVQRAEPIRLECVARGYLFGSAWVEYQERGTMNGQQMPQGLQQAQQLSEPMFTPSTKAETGHDEALTREEAVAMVGEARYKELADLTVELYRFGAAHARERGIILADTKFEFGVLPGGELVVIDEMMTPDSSRYWPEDEYEIGTSPPSFDKQFVRDYLSGITDWDRSAPAPQLPPHVVEGTRERYIEAYERVTDQPFSQWYGMLKQNHP